MLHNTSVTLYTRHLSHIDQQGYLGLGLETNLYQQTEDVEFERQGCLSGREGFMEDAIKLYHGK